MKKKPCEFAGVIHMNRRDRYEQEHEFDDEGGEFNADTRDNDEN